MLIIYLCLFLGVGALLSLFVREVRTKHLGIWFMSWLRHRAAKPSAGTTQHIIFAFADHFEPQWKRPNIDLERHRVDRWLTAYPGIAARHRDADGRAPVHSFFYPEEEYREEHLNKLQKLCEMGVAELEVHLHHDNDTASNFCRTLGNFVTILHKQHGALPVDPDTGQPRFAFIHGNWALDNSHPKGKYCGIDNEITLLKELGCYVDMTMPSAPDPTQTRTINSLYYVQDDPLRPKSHDSGRPVQVDGSPWGDLLCVQGPLGFNFRSRKWGLLPRIEASDVSVWAPPTKERVDLWVNTGIQVEGRPEWTFIKVHGHCAQDDDAAMLFDGGGLDRLFGYLESHYNDGKRYQLHYVSAREMYNIIKAAEAGKQGNPGDYRDFHLGPPENFMRDPLVAGVAK